jgi:hypothetical protein
VPVLRLPVTGRDVSLRLPDGADDILLLEAGTPDLGLALALLGRVARTRDGAPLDVAALPVTDVEALVLGVRQCVVGDLVTAEEVCAAPGCGARVDISFGIAAYIEHHRPVAPPGILPAADEGWYRLPDEAVEFRLPRGADQLAIALAGSPEEALLQLCLRPSDVSGRARQSAESAMEAMAPSLCSELEGACPECGATVVATFDPVQYTLRELRDQANFVYEDVCAIAHHYHWSEAEILALPAARRARYAELAPPPQRTTA